MTNTMIPKMLKCQHVKFFIVQVCENIIQQLTFLLPFKKGIGGNLEFAPRKVEVSSEESRTLLRGNFHFAKRPKKGALYGCPRRW